MKLITNPNGEQPIYEQLELQIKEQITGGALPAGAPLPSIRTLAKELKIGIITAKRVYDDLVAEGYAVAIAGKGVFVAETDREKLSEAGEEELKKRLSLCVRYAKANGLDREKFEKITGDLWNEK